MGSLGALWSIGGLWTTGRFTFLSPSESWLATPQGISQLVWIQCPIPTCENSLILCVNLHLCSSGAKCQIQMRKWIIGTQIWEKHCVSKMWAVPWHKRDVVLSLYVERCLLLLRSFFHRISENNLRAMDNSPTAAQQYLKYRVIFHHWIVCWFLFFRSLKTRLRHCCKGCYFSMLDATEQLCRIRCGHGAARKLFKGRAESGDDEGSWTASWGWTDLLERWWLRRSRELLACISLLVYGAVCAVCIPLSLSPGMGVPSVLVAPLYGAWVCFEGCVWLKRWPIWPGKIFLCFLGKDSAGSMGCCRDPSSYFVKVWSVWCFQWPSVSGVSGFTFWPICEMWPEQLRGFVCPQCNLCEHENNYFWLYPEWICLLHLFLIQTLPVEDAELVGQSFTS